VDETCSTYCRQHMRERYAYKIFVRKSNEKRSLGRPRRKWEDSIKMDLKEI
jgi:hypothetical protein